MLYGTLWITSHLFVNIYFRFWSSVASLLFAGCCIYDTMLLAVGCCIWFGFSAPCKSALRIQMRYSSIVLFRCRLFFFFCAPQANLKWSLKWIWANAVQNIKTERLTGGSRERGRRATASGRGMWKQKETKQENERKEITWFWDAFSQFGRWETEIFGENKIRNMHANATTGRCMDGTHTHTQQDNKIYDFYLIFSFESQVNCAIFHFG